MLIDCDCREWQDLHIAPALDSDMMTHTNFALFRTFAKWGGGHHNIANFLERRVTFDVANANARQLLRHLLKGGEFPRSPFREHALERS